MKKPDFPYYLTSFLGKYLPGQKNVSRNTIESYAVTFKLFFFFCESEKNLKTEKITIHTITCQLILEYLDWLETQRGCAISTRNQRLVALHSFFRYVQKQKPECMEEISRILDIPYKKTAKAMVPYLTGDEMRILLSQPDSSTREGFRDLVLLSVLYDTAARVQELADLEIKDVRIEKPSVITLHGKGNKTRQVPIMDKTQNLLQHYLDRHMGNTYISQGSRPLFINQKKQKLSRWGISYIINKYVDKAKKDPAFRVDFPITHHVFRHSKSMHMLQAGVNLIYIRDFLGHVDCSTTEIYARADTEMKRKAIEAAYNDVLPASNEPSWQEDPDLMNFLNSLCQRDS